MKIRALSADIYAAKDCRYDTSNGGISSRFDEVFIECERGPLEFDTDDLPENFVRVGEIMGHVYARPWRDPDKGSVGWMAGGSLVYTSDSRFRQFVNEYPIMLHDRQETREEYDLYSR